MNTYLGVFISLQTAIVIVILIEIIEQIIIKYKDK